MNHFLECFLNYHEAFNIFCACRFYGDSSHYSNKTEKLTLVSPAKSAVSELQIVLLIALLLLLCWSGAKLSFFPMNSPLQNLTELPFRPWNLAAPCNCPVADGAMRPSAVTAILSGWFFLQGRKWNFQVCGSNGFNLKANSFGRGKCVCLHGMHATGGLSHVIHI